MDAQAHTTPHSPTALHRAYLDAMRRHAEQVAQRTEPTNESVIRAHRRAVAIERLRASVVDIDLG
jgi:hypothetical protein